MKGPAQCSDVCAEALPSGAPAGLRPCGGRCTSWEGWAEPGSCLCSTGQCAPSTLSVDGASPGDAGAGEGRPQSHGRGLTQSPSAPSVLRVSFLRVPSGTESKQVSESTQSPGFWTWNSLRFHCSCVTSGRSLALSWPVFSSVKRTAVTRWGCVHSGRRLETNARSRVEGPIGWVFLPYCHLLCTLREWLSRLFQRR